MKYNSNDLIKLGLKRVYIVDCEDIYYFEDLKKALINEVKRDTIENREDKDIVENNLKLLEKIYSDNYGFNENFLIEELRAFGYGITKVDNIVSGLLDLKDYWKYHSIIKTEENENIKNIDNLITEICNYFND